MNKKSRFQRLKWAGTGMLLSLVLFALPASAAWNDTYQGYATYTGSGYSGGAVLLDPIPADMKITALNPFQLNYNGVKAALAGAYLEVREQRFDRHGIRQLYDSDAYPLPRRKAEV